MPASQLVAHLIMGAIMQLPHCLANIDYHCPIWPCLVLLNCPFGLQTGTNHLPLAIYLLIYFVLGSVGDQPRNYANHYYEIQCSCLALKRLFQSLYHQQDHCLIEIA